VDDSFTLIADLSQVANRKLKLIFLITFKENSNYFNFNENGRFLSE